MTRRRDPTEPSLPTKKRLFALSSNRCAFPRCTATLVDGDTVVEKFATSNGRGPAAHGMIAIRAPRSATVSIT